MIYAICAQATTDAVRSVLGDADTVQTVKNCRDSLSEAQRLPVDTLIVDVSTIHSADDVLAYRTTVRQCPRIVLLAPDVVPGNKTIGQLVSYGVYDIVTDLGRLSDVIEDPPATIVQAARWIVRDQQSDRQKIKQTVTWVPTVKGIGRRVVSAIAQACKRTGSMAQALVFRIHATRKERQAEEIGKKTDTPDRNTQPNWPPPDFVQSEVQQDMVCMPYHNDGTAIPAPDPILSTVPVWEDERQPKPTQPEPTVVPRPRGQRVPLRHIVSVITVESWDLARALALLLWRAAVLSVQLLPYALAAELAVMLGYAPHWAGVAAHGYWSVAYAIDPHMPTMQAMWHYVTHLSGLIGLGGGKA